jgi:hypothetical protein
MPTASDLVTDLPADFEVFGQAVDTSLADLKGGTTGQVLAKASNTNMDFTWVAQDDSNAIQNAIVDAKGDLIAASANDTPARLAVGNNGETLVADSSTSTGLRYQSAYNGNGVINGGMDIWQRGTSFALTSPSVAYTADRWLGRHFGANVTYSQQTSGLTGIQYSLRVQRPNGTTATNEQSVYYQFETADSYRFAGQTVTLSFWAKAGANFSQPSSILTSQIYSGTGTNQNITSGAYTGQVTVANQNNTLTTSWQRFSVTAAVGSTATQIALLFITTPSGTAGANDWFEITGVQLEVGSVATSFKRSGSGGGTIQGELAACQRYFWRYAPDISTNTTFASGLAISTTRAIVPVRYPVVMRTTPSFSWSSVTGHFRVYSGGYSTSDVTSLSLNSGGTQAFELDLGVASGLTTGNVVLSGTASSSAFMNLSAEL